MTVRVLLVITDRERRGPQVFALDLERALAARGLVPRLVALEHGQGERLLPVEALGGRRLAPGTLVRLRRAMRATDVVIALGSTTLPTTHLAGAGLGVPIIYRSIGDLLWWARSPLRRWRTGWLLRRSSRVVPTWPAAGALIVERLGVDGARVVTIPSVASGEVGEPVTDSERAEARCSLGLPAEVPVALCLGALAPEKAVQSAIAAVEALPGWHLLVVGDGPDRRAVSAAAARAGERVHVLGALVDIRPVLAAADLLVAPSRTEGIPAALIEAALAGLPAVASDVGGISTVVLDGVTGRLVPAGDHAALVTALGEVWARRHQLGPAARSHCASSFTVAATADRWATLVREVAAGAG